MANHARGLANHNACLRSLRPGRRFRPASRVAFLLAGLWLGACAPGAGPGPTPTQRALATLPATFAAGVTPPSTIPVSPSAASQPTATAMAPDTPTAAVGATQSAGPTTASQASNGGAGPQFSVESNCQVTVKG